MKLLIVILGMVCIHLVPPSAPRPVECSPQHRSGPLQKSRSSYLPSFLWSKKSRSRLVSSLFCRREDAVEDEVDPRQVRAVARLKELQDAYNDMGHIYGHKSNTMKSLETMANEKEQSLKLNTKPHIGADREKRSHSPSKKLVWKQFGEYGAPPLKYISPSDIDWRAVKVPIQTPHRPCQGIHPPSMEAVVDLILICFCFAIRHRGTYLQLSMFLNTQLHEETDNEAMNNAYLFSPFVNRSEDGSPPNEFFDSLGGWRTRETLTYIR
ncbi:hypothetical protein SeLEV6574_g03935 [Synchytrium endobioticum]|uniref:Uncharacterized protein n=1 Tax=Synchytrium endobioticum TaxID=286115 RepID=A0A507D1G6_9FUNG|nr:hypothetical protein SeLEV6574_g03935 [Synchytrium endobioticum]